MTKKKTRYKYIAVDPVPKFPIGTCLDPGRVLSVDSVRKGRQFMITLWSWPVDEFKELEDKELKGA